MQISEVNTEREAQSESRRRSEGNMEQITQTEVLLQMEGMANLGGWAWDILDDALVASEGLWRIFDLPPSGKTRIEETFLKRVHPADYLTVENFLKELKSRPAPFQRDFRIVRSNRSERLLRATGKIIADEAGLVVRMFGVLQDITDSKMVEQKNQAHRDRMFQNFAHQIKSPAAQALVRAQRALDAMQLEDDRLLLRPVRGLCRKVRRVAFNLHILAELDNPQVKWRPLDMQRLVKSLREAAQDAELTIEDYRNQRFFVDVGTFALRSTEIVRVDYDLLDQAVGNLFDNAAKYSYPHTAVRVYGGVTGSGRFHISVASKGIRLEGHEVPLCIQRGWRSERATWFTGEGYGIGLYVVERVMRAMGGELHITPTQSDDITEFKLVLPIQRTR